MYIINNKFKNMKKVMCLSLILVFVLASKLKQMPDLQK